MVDVLYIGIEAIEIEKVQAALIDSEDKVLLIYMRDMWEIIQPIVKQIPLDEIINATGNFQSMAYLSFM